jgi:hypothetical protein
MPSEEVIAAITAGGFLLGATFFGAKVEAVAAYRRQREAFDHDRELANLTDLRSLLDEAAITIQRSNCKFGNLVELFAEHGKDLPDEPRDELDEAGRDMLALSARLNIRPGENRSVISPFARARDEMLETLHKIHRDEVSEAPDDVIEEKLIEVVLSKVAFDDAWAEFTAAAVKRFGTVSLFRLLGANRGNCSLGADHWGQGHEGEGCRHMWG